MLPLPLRGPLALWLVTTVATAAAAGACVRGGFGPGNDAARQDRDAQATDLTVDAPWTNPWLGSFALSTSQAPIDMVDDQ